MKYIQRIIEDIKRGENIDLIVTVTAAFVVAVLNLFSITPTNWMNSIGLAVLALLASAILGNRHRLDDIQLKLVQTGDREIFKEFPEELNQDIEKASEIWLFGTYVIAAMRYYRPLLENKLRKGRQIQIKVFIIDPKGFAVNISAARAPGRPSAERERANITANLEDLCELKKILPSKMEIRVIDDPLFYGGYMLNPNSPDGVIYLRRYTYQAGITPKYVYHKSNQQWFELIYSEINSLWNRGVEWKCKEQEIDNN